DDVVVLADQAGTNGLRGRIGSRRDDGSEGYGTAARSGIGDGTDARRGAIIARVGNDEFVGGVEAGAQVVGRQSGVQLGEGLAGAESDAGRRSAGGGSDPQNVGGFNGDAVNQIGGSATQRSG